jgi:hypothetical protein
MCTLSNTHYALCAQAFGALTNALTTTVKNNTTGRPMTNGEVVTNVSDPAACRLMCVASVPSSGGAPPATVC